jgi:hypothetical protein
MSPVRRTVSLLLASALTIAGGALSVMMLTADRWRGHLVLGAGLMLGVGLFWLWSDLFNAESKQED